MKILIFSDSHRNVRAMVNIVENENPDYIIHLGDLETDAHEIAQRYPRIPVCSVAGNCDLWPRGKTRLLFELYGKKFFITHGHMYNVKLGLDGIRNTALTAGADICLFGHTHIPHYEETAGMLLINPGSVGMDSRTYGTLTLKDNETLYDVRKA